MIARAPLQGEGNNTQSVLQVHQTPIRARAQSLLPTAWRGVENFTRSSGAKYDFPLL